MKWSPLIVFPVAALMIASCKVKVVVPEGGTVASESGTYNCEPAKPCNINIVDIFFDETFTANPANGYEFHSWKTQRRALCAGTSNPCKLSTTSFAQYPALMALLESDEVFNLTPVFVKRTDILRSFEEGDRIKYTGSISSTAPDGTLTTAKVTAVREFFETDNVVDGFSVMLHELTLRLKSDGSEYPEASYYWQDGNGAWFDLSDTGGNFILDPRTKKFGVIGYPSPLIPRSNQTFRLQLVAPDNIRNPIADVTFKLAVSDLTRVVVPLGSFRAYKVSSTIDLEILAGSSAGTRVNLEQAHWVVPHIGPVKTELLQQNLDPRGADLGTFSSELEAVSINF
jgi:hypothetical protein